MIGLKTNNLGECRMSCWTDGHARWVPRYVVKIENGLVVP